MSQFQLSFNAKCAAAIQYEQTRYPNEESIETIKQGHKLLLYRKYDKAIAHANLTLDNYNPEIVPCLDIRLRAHMAEREYTKALEDAVEMQIRVPHSYLGYIRAVQIHIIRHQFKLAFTSLKIGFDNLKQQEDIEALAKSLCLLDTAAADFGMMKQFDDAHELADMMITLIPRSPIGYLRAGTVYLLQGKADKALKMYNRGIAKASNIQQLRRRKDYVLRRFKNNDHITRAPFDVLEWIVHHLSSHDLFTCLDVCYDWRIRFQQYPQPWRNIEVCDHANMDVLQQARTYIQTIYIPDTAICMVKSCLKLVSSGAFPNLVELDINNNDRLSLKSCPLRAHSKERRQRTDLSRSVLTHFQALKLVLEQRLAPICPHLNDLLDCEPHNMLSVTLACPTLREFVLQDGSVFENALKAKTYQSKVERSRAYNSLATDIVNPQILSDGEWSRLPDITSTTIKKLSFSNKGANKLKEWIGLCPELEDLTLKNMNGMGCTIFYAIKRLLKLRRLEIRSCEGPNRARFESYFHMLAYKRDQVQLHKVILNDFDAVFSETLDAMSRYRHLRSLTLINCKFVNGMAIGRFAAQLKATDSSLEELVLVKIGAITDAILVQVVKLIPRLQRLGLEQLDYVTDDGIIRIVDSSSHTPLSVLCICNCAQVTDRAVNYAMRRLSVETNSSMVLDEGNY